MEEMTDKIEVENRTFSAEETAEFDQFEEQVKNIDATVERLQRALQAQNTEPETAEPETRTAEEMEMRAFEAFVRGEERADMTITANNKVIPTTVVNKIIAKVKDTSPLFAMATHYNIKGNLSIPYVSASASSINVGFTSDFTAPAGSAVILDTVDLTYHLAHAKALIGKQLINNANFDVVGFIIDKMAADIAAWLDGILIKGDASEGVNGLSGATQIVTAGSAAAITADDLIDLQEKVPDMYQNNACWIMNRATRAAIRKLKDGNGQLILNQDATAQWGYTLFGKPVYCSDGAEGIATKKAVIHYGDFSGLAVKLSEEAEIEVLRERYADQHAVGVLAYLDFDADIEDAQKIAVLKMA